MTLLFIYVVLSKDQCVGAITALNGTFPTEKIVNQYKSRDKIQVEVLETLRRNGAYYKSPASGPLVGYAGTYEVNVPGEPKLKHFVGVEYFNLRILKSQPLIWKQWAEDLVAEWWNVKVIRRPDVVLGAPGGGTLFANALALAFGDGCRVVCAEKKFKKQSTTVNGRDETELVFDLDQIQPRNVVLVADDVCHKFSTTKELLNLAVGRGGFVLSVACVVNRSGFHYLEIGKGQILSVPSLAFVETKQYKQEDLMVVDQIAKGNVVWQPKIPANWAKLIHTQESANTV